MSSPDILSLTLQGLRSFLSPGRTTKIAPLTPRGIGLEALDQQRLELAARPVLAHVPRRRSNYALRPPSRDPVGNHSVSNRVDNCIIVHPIQIMGDVHGHK